MAVQGIKDRKDQSILQSGQALQQQAAQPGVQLSGAPTAQLGGMSAQPATNPQKPASSFTNLQQYLTAQKPSSDVSGRIGSSISKAGEKAEQAKEAATSGFSQAKKAEQDRINMASNLQAQLKSGTGAADLLANQESKKQFDTLMQGTVTKPTLDLAAAQTQANKLKAMSNIAEGAQGRADLLRSTLSPTQQYTAGQSKLDQLFLQGDKSQQLKQQAASQYKAAQDALDAAAKTGKADLTTLQAQADAAKKMLSETLTGEISGVESAVDTGIQSKQQQIDNAFASAQARLAKGQDLNVTERQMLGLPAYGPIFTTDYKGLAGGLEKAQAGASNIMTPEQLARYNALTQLAGQTGKYDVAANQLAAIDKPLSLSATAKESMDTAKAAAKTEWDKFILGLRDIQKAPGISPTEDNTQISGSLTGGVGPDKIQQQVNAFENILSTLGKYSYRGKTPGIDPGYQNAINLLNQYSQAFGSPGRLGDEFATLVKPAVKSPTAVATQPVEEPTGQLRLI